MAATRTMITFKAGTIRFSYRIGAIILHDGQLLCEEGMQNDQIFWFLPGGRAELLETASETLHRELSEELGGAPTSERLLFINENFFGSPEKRQHELGLYFLVTLPEDAAIYQESQSFTLVDNDRQFGKQLSFRWLRLDSLEKFALYPTFLRSSLQQLSEQITHVTTIED